MDHNSIIDRETFKVYTHSEDYHKAFICDKFLAPVVATLNKKGYKTFACCQGHYKVEFYEYFNENLDNLEKLKQDKHIVIKNITDTGFDYWKEVTKTGIYILFETKYNFPVLPNGFILETFSDKTDIHRNIQFYDENDNKRRRYEIESEIEKYCEILKKWAEDLPERKE